MSVNWNGCIQVMIATSCLHEAAKNTYIHLDVEGVKKKRRLKKEKYIDVEKCDFWKKFKVAGKGNFGSPLTVVAFLSVLFPNTPGVLLGGSTRMEVCRVNEDLIDKRKKKKCSLVKEKATTKASPQDQRLIAAGDDTGTVHVFDTQNCTQLRRLSAHKGSVRCCCFAREKLTYLLTGGDDAVLRLWDICDGSCVLHIPDSHNDIISCATAGYSTCPSSLLFATGGYDCFVKLWSFSTLKLPVISTPDESPSSMTLSDAYRIVTSLNHEHRVEALVFFRNKSLLITAGGPVIKIWDTCGGGVLKHCINSHVKTVTGVDVAYDGSYIVSASLDQTVKFHSPSTFTLLHSTAYNEPVTNLALLVDNTKTEWLLIALNNGEWVLRQRVTVSSTRSIEENRKAALQLRSGTASFFKRGLEYSPNKDDIVVDTVVAKRSCWLDRLIQGFFHQKSLDEAIRKGPCATIALIEALIEQDALHVAVRGRDEESILPLLSFVHRELMRDEKATPLLFEFTHVLLAENAWLYQTVDQKVLQALERLSSKLELDISQHQILRELVGILDIIGDVSDE